MIAYENPSYSAQALSFFSFFLCKQFILQILLKNQRLYFITYQQVLDHWGHIRGTGCPQLDFSSAFAVDLNIFLDLKELV